MTYARYLFSWRIHYGKSNYSGQRRSHLTFTRITSQLNGTWRETHNDDNDEYPADMAGMILGLRPSDEGRHYFVTTSLIGSAQT